MSEKRAKVFFFICLLTLCDISLASSSEKNVLFITVDDMNWDSVAKVFSNTPSLTPNIDKLAAEGMQFQYAHLTTSICQPNRAVWLTGLYPHNNGVTGFNNLNPNIETIPELLKASGIRIGIIGKTRHSLPSRKDIWDYRISSELLEASRNPEQYYEYTSKFIGEAASANQRFFLLINIKDPHRPFAGTTGEKYKTRKAAAKNKEADWYKSAQNYINSILSTSSSSAIIEIDPDEITTPGFLPNLPDIREELSSYYSSVYRADMSVGRIMDALSEQGLDKETIVIFSSDNGMAFPFAKTNLYMHSTRTPLIFRNRDLTESGRIDKDHVIAGIDIAPTILDIMGVDKGSELDGRSILPLIKGQKQAEREFVFTQFTRTKANNDYPMRSIIGKRYGYIFNAWSDGKTEFINESQTGLTMQAMREAAASDPQINERVQFFLYRSKEEFYDYEKDPDATKNLISDGGYTEIIEEYRKRLLEQMRRTEDPLFSTYESFHADRYTPL
jgi:N-sulfoglucosamine sulfohydrolase